MRIGIDIGGSKITGVVFNGKRAEKNLTITSPKNLKNFKQAIQELIAFLSLSKKIDAIGAGIPGAIDSNGKVVYAPNMKYLIGFNLSIFLKKLGVKRVVIENDAKCFALAESILGTGKYIKSFIGITLGTGIGGGIIIEDQLYKGGDVSAGEVGHLLADKKNTYEKLFQIYRRKKNYVLMGKLLGRMFADVYNLLDIKAIILGGSVAQSAKHFLLSARMEMKKYILNKKIKPKILVSTLKNAGAIGAALLIK